MKNIHIYNKILCSRGLNLVYKIIVLFLIARFGPDYIISDFLILIIYLRSTVSPSAGIISFSLGMPALSASLRKILRVVWQWSIASMCTAIKRHFAGDSLIISTTSFSFIMRVPYSGDKSGMIAPPELIMTQSG